MEVGPSAAPMIPIEAASFRSNPRMVDSKIAAKIPSCAPAPNRNKEGLESRGPKQGWFKSLFDSQPDQGDSDGKHHNLLPG